MKSANSSGVVVRSYDESPSMVPGFKTVSMRDIIIQPGAKTMGPPMPNAMVCHVLEGELRGFLAAPIGQRRADRLGFLEARNVVAAEAAVLADSATGDEFELALDAVLVVDAYQ